MPDTVRVRFAPSPTGSFHVGSARTALFNWAFARRHRGTFILRIEDTDSSRSTEAHIGQIVEAMRWLGFDWDEGPPSPGYRQTERFEIYRAHAERLLAEGRAYRCRCTPETLDALRDAARARKEQFRYPGTCREANVPASEPHALRLRVPREGRTTVEDAILGDVSFDNATLDDWILVRTDGTPTYNFCVVVDDVTMKITHVIRGNDHLSNTPKQIVCYEALGYATPVFAHIPMILAADRSKMSKRHGATTVEEFRDQGILPEAMVNYLARLGWSHGDKEIFSPAEIAAHFSLEHVGKAGAVFDREKLNWIALEWIKATPPARLAALLPPFLERAGYPAATMEATRLEKIAQTLQERSHTLVEMAEQAVFYFRAPAAYDPQATARFWGPEAPARYAALIKRHQVQEAFDPESLEALYRGLAAEMSLKLVDLAQLTRLALTGKAASPPIFQVAAILGKPETIDRLKSAQRAASTVR
ncbi:MAG TPA: glutamate--tRNA ligase [Candidatus Bathyarchaeia archaeon]|nr:glutamate--tRNA ligase [Candidatus Bathyarchaeia archaeon]